MIQSTIIDGQSNSKSNRKEDSRDTEDNEEETGLFHKFKQQMLKAWLPVPTLSKTIILFFVMSAIFLGIGIPMIILSDNIVEI